MCKEENADVFNTVYEKVFPTLVRIAYHTTGDMIIAEDLCHEALLKYHERNISFPDYDQTKYWLIRVVKNLSLNYEKRRTRESRAYAKFSKEPQGKAESGETLYLKKEMELSLNNALQELPEKLRTVLVLREYGDLNYKEISKILKITEGNVKVRIYRARERLGELLKDGGFNVS